MSDDAAISDIFSSVDPSAAVETAADSEPLGETIVQNNNNNTTAVAAEGDPSRAEGTAAAPRMAPGKEEGEVVMPYKYPAGIIRIGDL